MQSGVDGARGARSVAPALEQNQLAAALTYDNAAGALTATKKGVISALPTASEVEKLLRERSQ
jgi:sugar/nucleoside kinase (ribokinase family)